MSSVVNDLSDNEAVGDLGLEGELPLLEASKSVYFDSAASAQKPRVVLDAIEHFYTSAYSNVHRGVYPLAIEATELYENARKVVAGFLGTEDAEEIVFTRNATEAINLVAYGRGRRSISSEDEVLITLLEHHSNIVPWQMLAEATGATLHFAALLDDGSLNLEDYKRKLSPRTKMVAFSGLSNATGFVLPVEEMISGAREVGALVLLDGAQACVHGEVNVKDLDVDFLALSGHKLYGPSGIGALFGKKELLANMAPFITGGDTIDTVSVEGTTFAEAPAKFEAGTPNTAGAIGLASAIEFLNGIGFDEIRKHDAVLTTKLINELQKLDGVSVFTSNAEQRAVVSFLVDGVHPVDLAQYMGEKGISLRAGHHCCQPLMKHFGVNATLRASIGLHNTTADVDKLIDCLVQGLKFFRR